ncbi:MAG: hypothetical protein LBV01_06180 [Deltaproteobacteria bacterium]|jgi:hypothetical protein|nr:hypothetical protein [Deltaproteobacteria bacterium]
MHMRIIVIILSCAALVALSGCGLFQRSSPAAGDSRPGKDVALTAHNPVSLHNYRVAREYSVAGRYELAREHYLLAYAAAEGDAPLRDTLSKELKAVDSMIRALR